MLRPLVIADASGKALRATLSYTLSLAYGDDENDFKLQIDRAAAPPVGGYVYIDGTEYGGVVDSVKNSKSRSGSNAAVCCGRTWHGVLAGKRIVPGPGSQHVEVSGPAGDVLGSLIGGMGLSGLYEADPGGTAVSHRFERFCDAYSGLRAMLASSGLKLSMRYESGRVRVSAPPVSRPGMDSDLLDFDIELIHRRVNHLVCAGVGEGAERVVVHLYADERGRVSKGQTLFGVDEITAYYDYNNADAAELEEKGAEKLAKMQGEGSLRIEVYDGLDLDVGDVVRGRDNWLGREVVAEVRKKEVKARNGLLRLSYEAGSAESVSTSNSTITAPSGGSSGGGGHAYYAGDGLRLEGFTFHSDVTQPELDAVAAKAETARKAASDATAAAGAALAEAKAKAPASHRHAWGDVDGAPGAYPPKPHTHDAVDIAGGHLAVERGGTGGADPKSAAKMLGFATKTSPEDVPDGADLDDYADPGSYASTYYKNEIGHNPSKYGAFRLEVDCPLGSIGYRRQTMTGYYAGAGTWTRYRSSDGTWSAWDRTQTASQAAEAFAAKAHAHPYAGSASPGGPARSAERLSAPRRIALTGAVTGSVVFDGSGDVSIATEGDAGAAGFLAAHPVGFYVQTAGADPNEHGGVWEHAPSIGPDTWLRKE